MQLITLATVGLFAALTAAQNAFIAPVADDTFAAGSSTTLEWDATTNGTVSLRLQWGATTTSTDGVAIASDIDNSGSYVWTIPTDIPVEDDYFIYIADDDDSSIVNYSARFYITGATGSTTTSASATTASATSTSTVVSSTSAASNTTTSAASTTSSASSSSSSAANSTTLVTSSTAVVASSTSAVATKSSSTSASASASSTTVADSGVAALQAPVLMLGVFAMGAFALL